MLEFAKRYRDFLGLIRDALQDISREQAFSFYVSSLPMVGVMRSIGEL